MKSDGIKGLERFIRREVFRSRTTPLECFQLRHALAGGRGTEVDTFPIPQGLEGDQLVTSLFEDLGERAQADANGLGSKVQRYEVVAREVGADGGPRYPFRLRGEEVEDDEGGASGEEAPTERGQLSQQMRHNEALMRMFTQLAGATHLTSSRQIANLEAQVVRLETERRDWVAMREAQLSEQHFREIDMLKVGGQEERKAAMFKQVEGLIPVVVNRLAGGPVIPPGPQADLMRVFVNSLNKQQVDDMLPQLGRILDPAQFATLVQLLKTAKAEADAEAARTQPTS